MNRKDYWDSNYVDYWKEKVNEAESNNEIYINKGDVKTVGDAILKQLIDEIEIKPNSKVLDVGCGFCRTYPLFSYDVDYYGVDISDAMINEAKKIYPALKSRLVVSEVEKIPYVNDFFDIIICFGVFDACYQNLALTEMLRVLKKGGVLILTGKNTRYNIDDEKALVAEIRAREKHHPNYFTNLNDMLYQLEKNVSYIQRRYFVYRGDFSEMKYTNDMPDYFYEFELTIKKELDLPQQLTDFSDEFSETFSKYSN